MNTAERQNITSYLDTIENQDISKRVAEAHPDQDLNAIQLEQYTMPEFVATFQRAISQLAHEITQTDNWKYLPDRFAYNGANAVLSSFLSNIISHLQSQQFQSVLLQLNLLVDYQLQYGFWDRNSLKLYRAENLQVEEKAVRVRLLTEQTAKAQETLRTEIKTIATERAALEAYRTERETQFQRLSQNQTDSDSLKQQINDSLTTATGLVSKLEALEQQQTKLATETETKRAAEIDSFAALSTEHKAAIRAVQQQETAFQARLAEYQEALEFAHETETFLKAKREEIIKLTGGAADGALGHSFNTRRDALNSGVQFWKWTTFTVAILALVWVIAVFTNGFGHWSPPSAVHNEWLVFLNNAVKSSLAVLVLTFASRQYTSERKLQEEYAFRAAVAQTLNAYADRIDDKPSQDKLILESVQRVYTSPQLFSEQGLPGNLSIQQLGELLKSVQEMIKQAKSN